MRPTSLVLTDEEIANFGKGGYPDWGRVRATLQHLQSKWEFEHALANDQQAEIERLDTEVIWLQDYGRIPQLERLLFAAREALDKYQTYVDGEGEDQNDESVIAVCRDIDTLVGPPRPRRHAMTAILGSNPQPDLEAIRERYQQPPGKPSATDVSVLLDYTEALIAALCETADYLSQSFFTREELAFAEKLHALLPPEPQR